MSSHCRGPVRTEGAFESNGTRDRQRRSRNRWHGPGAWRPLCDFGSVKFQIQPDHFGIFGMRDDQGDLYTPSVRVYAPPPEPEYPYHDKSVRVTHCGRICVGRRKINLSRVFAGQIVGIREVDDQIWLVSFLDYDLASLIGMRDGLNPLRIPSCRRKC